MPVSLFAGAMGAVQSRITSRLATELHDGFSAAAVSFGVGMLLLMVLIGVRPGLRRQVADFARDLRSGAFPWVLALGGLGGATFVLGQGLSVALIGVALFIVCVVAGQTVTGLAVDRIGLGPGGPRPLSPARALGAALMVGSVALAMSGGVSGHAPWYLLALPVVAGLAMGLQQAVNGRVSEHSGHFMVATLTNFVVGTAALLLAAVVHAVVIGQGPARLPANPLLYLGGVIGVAYIAMAAHLVRIVGVLTLAMATIAGQIVGSVALDWLLPAPGSQLRLMTVVGAALTLVATAVTAGFRRR
ncbi:hypothetical protein CGZ93_05225 [Enemella dayhoffiae]|uniref:DMT family transporter n=2 Tax=Enemella dayhoffiae TaxID=2016507 RepID=A0A255H8R4_9ACTN|nr:hypothetical protein CGZ93_05225 [Enemella dayhoffiae]